MKGSAASCTFATQVGAVGVIISNHMVQTGRPFLDCDEPKLEKARPALTRMLLFVFLF
jgi:hypothetical protein